MKAMKAKLQQFMFGRYGQDMLNRALSIVSLILYLLALFTGWFIPYIVACAMLVFCVYRMFSKNFNKRINENRMFIQLVSTVQKPFKTIGQRLSQSKTHRYFRCPSCHQTVRVPKGKGKISIHCPKCSTDFIKKS